MTMSPGSAPTPARNGEISPRVRPHPPRKPQPSVQEWLVLHERGVIDGAELRQQLGLGEPNGGSSS